jgi:hypothetical protein
MPRQEPSENQAEYFSFSVFTQGQSLNDQFVLSESSTDTPFRERGNHAKNSFSV